MPTANLNNPATSIDLKNRGIVIVDNFRSIRGGATLDVTGFVPDYITEGHVIIKETSTGNYKPLNTNAGMTAYVALPAGHTYQGVLINHEIPKSKPFAGIMYDGTINPVAAPYDFATIAVAFKTAVPLIEQRAD